MNKQKKHSFPIPYKKGTLDIFKALDYEKALRHSYDFTRNLQQTQGSDWHFRLKSCIIAWK
jgi:hypothetical protein